MNTEAKAREVLRIWRDGELIDTVEVTHCWGRDSRGEVVRFNCAVSYLVNPGYEEAIFVRLAAPGSRGGRHVPDRTSYDRKFQDVYREVLLLGGRSWQELRWGTVEEIAHESALRRFEHRGPKALLAAREVA